MSGGEYFQALPDGAPRAAHAQKLPLVEAGPSGGALREAVAELSGLCLLRPPSHVPPLRADAASLGRRALRRRTARLQHFSYDLAQDGVWNILLELVIAKAENRAVPIKCLWLASGAPQSSALRWVNQLVASGHVTRNFDPADRRCQFIEIDDDLARQIVDFLRATEP